MAGTHITIDDGEVVKAFNQLINSGGDLTEVLTAIGLGWDSYVADEFANSVDPYGNKWTPLTFATLVSRAQSKQPKKNKKGYRRRVELGKAQILVDHGHLRDSYHPYISQDGKTMVFGTDMIYGAAHQFGYEKRHLPARPTLPDNGWPDEWKNETLNMISQHLENSVA